MWCPSWSWSWSSQSYFEISSPNLRQLKFITCPMQHEFRSTNKLDNRESCVMNIYSHQSLMLCHNNWLITSLSLYSQVWLMKNIWSNLVSRIKCQWTSRSQNLLQGDNYRWVHFLTQTWQKANQHLDLTSTSWNYKSNHIMATPWNG